MLDRWDEVSFTPGVQNKSSVLQKNTNTLNTQRFFLVCVFSQNLTCVLCVLSSTPQLCVLQSTWCVSSTASSRLWGPAGTTATGRVPAASAVKVTPKLKHLRNTDDVKNTDAALNPRFLLSVQVWWSDVQLHLPSSVSLPSLAAFFFSDCFCCLKPSCICLLHLSWLSLWSSSRGLRPSSALLQREGGLLRPAETGRAAVPPEEDTQR